MTSIQSEVLAFYKEFPFNRGDSVDADIERIKATDIGSIYPLLPPLLKGRPHVLEIGCGIGWMACGIAYHWQCDVTAIDFNPVAIVRAKNIAAAMRLNVDFQLENLFTYEPKIPADLVISLGVLHHTHDCHGAIRRCLTQFTNPSKGYFLVGLYHLFGRRAFRRHFEEMKKAGLREDDLFQEYRRLHHWLGDETHLRSWFRDQVLHPHETQHTLSEIALVGRACGAHVVSTSINQFGPIDDMRTVLAQESVYEELGNKRLFAGEFFPGFFVTLFKNALSKPSFGL